MESIIDRLSEQQTWEEFLTYRLLKGRFNTAMSSEDCSAVSRCRCLPVIW